MIDPDDWIKKRLWKQFWLIAFLPTSNFWDKQRWFQDFPWEASLRQRVLASNQASHVVSGEAKAPPENEALKTTNNAAVEWRKTESLAQNLKCYGGFLF